jgi:transposase InsO family protein
VKWYLNIEEISNINYKNELGYFLRELCTEFEVFTIPIDYIKPSSPYQNGHIERFNCTYRTEVLDLYFSNNLEQARKVTEE